MKRVDDQRTIMIVEDHEGYIDLLEEICRDALWPLEISRTKQEKDADIYLVVAKKLGEARSGLKENVYLSTVDINLSGELFRGKAAEGMEILKEIKTSYPLVCPVVISSEDTSLHQKKALRKFDAIDYINKKDLDEKETEIKKLLKTTFVYAEALRLFDKGEWSQTESIWRTIVKENPEFIEIDKDTKNLDEQLKSKRSSLTGLPGREWVWKELDLIRQDASKINHVIILVSIEGFKSFQNSRKLKGAEDVLMYVAQVLENTVKDVEKNDHFSVSDLLSVIQSSDNTEISNRVFLGEADNTGLFVLVTPSSQVAEKIKKGIDENLTDYILKKFHSYEEMETAKADLMSVDTRIKTFSDIMVIDNTDNITRDRFEEFLFEDFTNKASSENKAQSEEQYMKKDNSRDVDEKKRGWFSFF